MKHYTFNTLCMPLYFSMNRTHTDDVAFKCLWSFAAKLLFLIFLKLKKRLRKFIKVLIKTNYVFSKRTRSKKQEKLNKQIKFL